MEPLVSVIIPVYNAEKYFDKCIKSVLCQSYKNIEIILINDGSTDCSLELCEFYASNEKNVKVFSQENSGAGSARNLGLYNAEGEYIVFVDSDDWVMPNYIEFLYDGLVKYSADMMIIDYHIENSEKSIYRKKEGLTNLYTGLETLDHIFDTDKYMGYLGNKIYQAKIIKENNIMFRPEIKVWEDLLFCCQYISEIKKVVYVQKPLYVYCLREDSLTKSTQFDIQKTLLYSAQNLMEIAKNPSSKFGRQTRKLYANANIDRIMMEFRKKEYDTRSILEKLSSAKPYFNYLTVKNRIKYLCLKTVPKLIFLLINRKIRMKRSPDQLIQH